MPLNDDPKSTMTARERGALAVAVAAVTVAIGLTLTSFAGRAPDAEATPPSAAIAAESVGPSTERVVLVPVSPVTEPAAPEERRAAGSARDDEEGEHDEDEDDDDDRHERRSRRHREHDDDDGWLAFAHEEGDSDD
jgi:hypothetical protein